MWPMPAVAHKFVAIFFTPNSLSCYYLDSVKDKQLVLRAYKNYPLNNLELANLILFNPTVIKKQITSFLQQHNLQDAFVTFVLHGPAVTEKFVAMPSSTPHRADFMMPNSANIMWEYRYVYPNDDGQFVFYVYSVPRYVVLQYKLLAIAAECNLITMTTQTMGLLSVYQHMFGSAFRRSQLAVDMMRCNNNIGEIITIDTLRRMMDVGGLNVTKDDYIQCASAAGLFYDEKL
jgi:hypothetical protein